MSDCDSAEGQINRHRQPPAKRLAEASYGASRLKRGTATQGTVVLTMLRGLLGGSKPVVLMTAFVAVVGLSGTAYATKTTRHVLGGDRGATGSKGDRGSAGAVGAVGGQGATGATGPQGLTGATGAIGPVGSAGARGPDGRNGSDGRNGASAVSYFASVSATGALSATQARDVASSSEAVAGSGAYQLQLAGSPDLSSCVAIAQVNDGAGSATTQTGPAGLVSVTTFGAGGVAADHAFVVTVSC